MSTLDEELKEILARAARIDALQRGFTSARDERAISEIFRATIGRGLTTLKNAIDAGEDYHTLHQLIYHDIEDAGIRAEMFAHLNVHAEPTGELKVFSDIDDTFYLNWRDKRYPGKTVYPGVRAMYRELDMGHGDEQQPGRRGDLVFLTARPYDRFGITDRLTHATLHAHGVMQAIILAGDFLHLLTNELIAEAKHKRFLEYVQLYPEYHYVFLGDSGQGDTMAGQMMLQHASVRAVFIHDVVDTPEAQREAYRQLRIHYHDTYVGAAVQAYNSGLIGRAGLRRIGQEALAELSAVRFDSDEQRALMQRHFQRDFAALDALLPTSERLAP